MPGLGQFARQFVAASSDRIALSLGSAISGQPEPLTMAAVVYRDTAVDGAMLGLNEAADISRALFAGAGNGLYFYDSHVTASGVNAILPLTTWILVVVNHPGTVTTAPRVHFLNFSTGVWTHQAGSPTFTPSTVTLAAPITIGSWANAAASFPFDGKIAAVGEWGANLSDAQIEGLAVNTTNGWAASAGGWIRRGAELVVSLDQSSTGTAVTDATGNGANQSSLTGTSVYTDATLSIPWVADIPDPVLRPAFNAIPFMGGH